MSKDALMATLTREMERIAKNSENWQERMAALGAIQRAFETLDDVSTVVGPDVWKVLQPLRGVVLDLRSQIVKEVCNLLLAIARVTRDAMVPFVRDIVPTLIDVRGSGNKVCGNYCNECVEALIAHTVVKGATLRYFSDTLLESKHKLIRLSCITALRLALVYWSAVLDKSDVQQLERGLKHALYDASASCRTEAHALFVLFHRKFPKRAALLLTAVDYKVQKRLEVLLADAAKSRAGGTGNGTNDSHAGSIDDDAAAVVVDADATATRLPTESFSVGDRVCIPEKELFGHVRYIGDIDGTKGAWVGVELDEPYGKNDGSAKGRHYFRCRPKHGVFARAHQIILSGTKRQEPPPGQLDAALDDESASVDDDGGSVLQALTDELSDVTLLAVPPPSSSDTASVANAAGDDEPSALTRVLQHASIVHRRYLDRLLQLARSELEEHERFDTYASTASSADAVQYLQQLQNCAQDKIVLSDMFIQEIIQAQQAARES